MTDPNSSSESTEDTPRTALIEEFTSHPIDVNSKSSTPAPETGGPKGPDPTRYGDWERKGRCIDF